MTAHPLLIILGPTASGKTKLAVQVAGAIDAEIISADSRQVFRGMDIGTGKDIEEYVTDGKSIPYHLINIKEAGDRYNVNEFKDDFYDAFEQITNVGKVPILCGGTGMYIHSVLQHQEYTAVPVDEDLRASLLSKDKEELKLMFLTHPEACRIKADLSSHKRLIRAIEIAMYLKDHQLISKQRPLIEPLVVGLAPDRELRRKRIMDRLDQRLEQGLIEEVVRLKAGGLSDDMLDFYGLEYRFVADYLNGDFDFSVFKERLATAIYQFAKRQMTFFRKMEKDGVEIHWLDPATDTNWLIDNILTLHENRFDK